MKPSAQIFTEAARRIAERENSFCCPALSWARGGGGDAWTASPERGFFEVVFCPRRIDPSYNWWEPCDTEARLLALLLAAELVRDGFTVEDFK